MKLSNNSRNVLIVCATVMFCFVGGAGLAVFRLTSDGPTALGVITLLFTQLGVTIAALAALIKGESVKQTAQETNDKVDRVLNGEMAAKIKTAYKEALKESGHPPETRPK